MSDHAPSIQSSTCVPLAVASATVLLAALCVDVYWLQLPPLSEHYPRYSAPYILESCLIALGSWLLVAAVAPRHRCRHRGADDGTLPWHSWGTIVWRPHDRAGLHQRSIATKRLIAWGFALGTLAFLLIAQRAPGLVSRVASEDGLVENLSAVVLLLASATFATVAVRMSRARHRGGWLSVLIPVGMALVVFVIAMEEISWMQRVFDVETPTVLSANDQDEMNFHNLATAEFENAYYFAGFLTFVFAPFLVDHGRVLDHRLVDDFAPSRFLIYPAATFVGFNFEMWNIVLTQIALFTTLFVLLHYGLARRRSDGKGTLQFALIGVVVVTQAAFFILSPRFDPYWLATEYKEFLIPVVVLLYAMEVAWSTRRETGEPPQPIAATSS